MDTIKSLWRLFPKGHLYAAGSLSFVLVATSALWTESDAQSATDTEVTKLALPSADRSSNLSSEVATASAADDSISGDQSADTAANSDVPALDPLTATPYETYRIAKGDSLSKVFSRLGLTQKTLYKVMNETVHAGVLKRIKPQQELAFKISDDMQLLELKYQIDQLTEVRFINNDGQFVSSKEVATPEVRHAFRQGRIEDSLFLAGTRAGLGHNLTMELANIFGYDIDFLLDIREGDEFAVVYEELYLNGQKIDNGRILAAEFTNKGKTYEAVYFDDEAQSGYFTPKGESMKKAFLRSPLDVARISSHFNLRRKHPVLNKIRAHKGTDYAAARGTPIRATGSGKVSFKGRKGGWGNVVMIQHGQTYKTLYAHMSKFAKGVGKGTHVKQGQVIGYVGSTGLATGPHLHYEFYENGAVRNPVTVKFPNSKDVSASKRVAFNQQTGQHMQTLAQFKTNLASL